MSCFLKILLWSAQARLRLDTLRLASGAGSNPDPSGRKQSGIPCQVRDATALHSQAHKDPNLHKTGFLPTQE
jgi:hypothetical protein